MIWKLCEIGDCNLFSWYLFLKVRYAAKQAQAAGAHVETDVVPSGMHSGLVFSHFVQVRSFFKVLH